MSKDYDLGQGQAFYLNATQQTLGKKNIKMYDYDYDRISVIAP